MATIGLRDLYCAPITADSNGNDVYGQPRRLAKAISADLSVETAEAILYGDDAVDDTAKEFVKGTLGLNVTDLPTIEQAALLGHTMDADGVLYAGEGDDPPYFAIGFRARKNNGHYRYIWLYKVKFSIPTDKFQTKGEKIEFTTPEITGTFIKRDDGLWKADAVLEPAAPAAQNWFSAVREKNPAPPAPGG
jgi:phi13 family phage major tail protein